MSAPIVIPQVQPWLGQEEAAAAARAVTDNWITEGPRSKELSEKLNQLIGVPYGVFAPNGTLALVLGLIALGIKSGDEVLVPNITFIGSANAVLMLGAVPVFVEVERVTFQIDVTKAEGLVNGRSRAIMPVHLYGTACNMRAVQAFAHRHGLHIIEDAAQGIGVSYFGRHVGGLGDVGCFSFFADKTLTTGEGGYVVCRDAAVYDRLRLLRNQGRFDRGSFIHPMIGYNFRMTDLQSAIGLVQFAKLDAIIERKSQILAWYRAELEDIAQVRILPAETGSTHVPFRCVLIAERASMLMKHLEDHGVQSRSFFYPLHMQPCFVDWAKTLSCPPALDDKDYPNSIFGYENGVCLPIFPTLSREQVRLIGSRIREFYS